MGRKSQIGRFGQNVYFREVPISASKSYLEVVEPILRYSFNKSGIMYAVFNDALMFLTPVIYRRPQLMKSGFDLKRPNTAGIGFRWGKALTQKCPQKLLLKYFCSIYVSLPHPSPKLKGRSIIVITSAWGGFSKSIVTNLGGSLMHYP